MKSTPTLAFVLTTTAALLSTAVNVGAQGLTRAQVQAELAQAQRSGDIVLNGETGLPANQVHPHLYPAVVAPLGKTRQQVRDELAEARRTGDFAASGEGGLLAYEAMPHRFPARPMAMGKTRQQVKEEYLLAVQLGDAPSLGDDGLTPAQRTPARFAAVRAEHARMRAVQPDMVVSQSAADPTAR